VALEWVAHSTAGTAGSTTRIRVDDPRKFGAFGIGGETYLEAHLRPDCGLVRFYAVERASGSSRRSCALAAIARTA